MFFQSIGDILELLVHRDWENFHSYVLSNPQTFRHVAGAVAACSQLHGMTVLHAAVKCNPPLDIVARIIEICPDMLDAKDCLHRTPLHVAAGSKATPSLLELLARAYPAACDAQDVEKKTPLHFACDSSCVLFEEDRSDDDKDDTRMHDDHEPPNHDVVAVLLLHSVHAVTLEDDEDMTPLEHAIMSNASTETVKLLQKKTQEAMQLTCEGEGLQSHRFQTPVEEIHDLR